jgi:hypothetical protein
MYFISRLLPPVLIGIWLAGAAVTARGQASAGFVVPAPLSPRRIDQIAHVLPATPAGFGLPCSDRAAWNRLKERFGSQLTKALAALQTPLPPWDDDSYLQFSRSGDRVRGETLINARQNPLTPLVLAECIDGEGRFIPRITQTLDSLSAEPSWTLPASDANLDNFSGRRYFVDLNAATLASTIAETLYLLGERLPQATRQNAMSALELHVFAPMREAYSRGSAESWLIMQSNWNPVCLNGVTGAALTVLQDRSDRALFVAGAEQYYTNYLKGFPVDGYAVEGIGYWSYGMQSFAALREHIWQATNGTLDLFHDPSVRTIALFGLQFQMLPGVFADFGDAQFMGSPDRQVISYLEEVFGIVDPLTHQLVRDGTKIQNSGDLASNVMTAFEIRSQFQRSASDQADLTGLRTYYPTSKVLVVRPAHGSQMGLTVKAGGNGNHSHNDIGSFSVGLGGTVPLGDPGGPSFYTASTFSSQRYQSPLLNSYGHPVPVIDGQLQLDATEVNAHVLSTSFNLDADSITIDMTPAYRVASLLHLDRTFRYSREGLGNVDIIDKFTLRQAADVEESLPTHGTWRQVDAHTIEFEFKGQRLEVSVDAPGPMTIAAKQFSEYGNSFTRVCVLVRLQSSGTITLHIAPIP